jgi:eukaryotic-like serine/threonine-protein kinase
MIGRTISHYRIVEKIGIGSMAVVYKAEDMLRNSFVALKLLSREVTQEPEAVIRFKREACAASALRHPHICTIQEIFDFEDHVFVAMELVDRPLFPKVRPWEMIWPKHIAEGVVIEVVCQFGAEIADALSAAHAKEIVHRDIKPSNISYAMS